MTMHPLLKWLIGLRQLPQEVGEGAWHLEFHSLPQGLQAVLAIAAAVGALAGVWFLYKFEGRSLSAASGSRSVHYGSWHSPA